jgi:hypothetical protein
MEEAQVVKRLVEPGDTAWPGKPLLVLQTSEALRLEALIREGLIERARPGAELDAVIDSTGQRLEAVVEELVPSADPQTRTFLVKARIEASPGVFPGMFGRLLVPVQERQVVAMPKAALRRIGQLEVARVKTEDGWKDFFIRTGQPLGEDKLEVLSGLDGDEVLALPAGR